MHVRGSQQRTLGKIVTEKSQSWSQENFHSTGLRISQRRRERRVEDHPKDWKERSWVTLWSAVSFFFLNLFLFIYFLVTPCRLLDLSSLTRNWTCAPCIGSLESTTGLLGMSLECCFCGGEGAESRVEKTGVGSLSLETAHEERPWFPFMLFICTKFYVSVCSVAQSCPTLLWPHGL